MARSPTQPISTFAFACLRQYALQSPDDCEPELLLVDPPNWMDGPRIIDRRTPGKALIEFRIRDRAGDVVNRAVGIDESGFAELRARTALGESAFIDRTEGIPYLKVFGSRERSAGIILPRILARAGEGDAVTYKNGNTLDLRATNLMVTAGRSTRTLVDVALHTLEKVFAIPRRLCVDWEGFKRLVADIEERYDGLHGHEIVRA